MARICVINPNSTAAMTDHLRHDLERIKRPDTELLVINPQHGPVLMESAYEETLAAAQIMPLVRRPMKRAMTPLSSPVSPIQGWMRPKRSPTSWC